MTILQIITKSELGGAQSVVINLSNKLAEEHRVIVLAGEGDGKMFNELDKRIIIYRCNSLVRKASPINDIKTLFFFYRVYNKYKPDIIHLHSSKSGALGRIVFPSSKTVYTVHGFDSIRLAFRKFLFLEKLLKRFCKAIVGVSMYDFYNLANEGIKDNVFTVYNGIKDCYIPHAEMAGKIPSKYKYKILCIARLAPPKNIDVFYETAKGMPHIAFVWIGNLKPVKNHPENVFFWGNIPYSGRQCRFFDLFMLPSNFEGLPIVLIEAMSCKLPIVASDVGGISELVQNEKNGYILPNDPTKFIEKIAYILSNDQMRKDMGEKSRELYLKHFTDTAMVNSYLDIYNK